MITQARKSSGSFFTLLTQPKEVVPFPSLCSIEQSSIPSYHITAMKKLVREILIENKACKYF